MAMSEQYKAQQANRMSNALRQLRKELAQEGQRHQCAAITDFLLNAGNDTMCKLAEIISPMPRPLGELVAEDEARREAAFNREAKNKLG